MNCPTCSVENPEGAKFCRECGASLAISLKCPNCGTPNLPGSKFCNECGRNLFEISPPSSALPVATSLTPVQPTSFASGRYAVKRFLGEGGKKRVYLAHDTLLDRDVAFAVIKTEGLDEAARERITREAQAMGRLSDHPHIVTIHDIGQEEGQPYLVLPLMPGGDVEGLIEKAEDHQLPLEQAIRITDQLCQALEHAHSKGIIHRDVKPGNVWLTADGTAKLGDFGLAVTIDRSRLTQAGMMVGTVSYMPPEQALGGEITARSDLYSVGAMLYEMVTGRPPFLGDDPVAIISQHLNTPPVSPTWHRASCPRPLEALILRLLAKDPAVRPAAAAEVRQALGRVDLAIAPPGLADGVEASLDSVAGGVFVGRQREMGELKAALEEALSGKGRLVTLVGEPGSGKTRTSQELATYAGLRGCQVLWGRCYEGTGVPAFWPWVQAIRSYVREREPEQLRAEMGSGAADIAEVVSDVRERLPGLERPPQLEAEAARFRLFDSVAAFLKGASRRQPLVLVLDDLHWADKPSLLLLEFVARELAGARLLLVGTYRDVELSRQHPLAETLGELTRERLFQRVLLRGLSEEDVGRFIDLITGRAAPSGLARAVHTQTEGNPLFVTEVVRLLVQEGHVDPQRTASSRNTGSWTIRIPEGVREVIGRRLNRLSARCNDTLTIAAVVGREFSLEVLGRLDEEMSQDRLLEVLEEALAGRVIEELPRTVGCYQFTHALIQETLAAELSTTRRVRLHGRIAQALEEVYGAQVEPHAAELAYHYGEAEAVLGAEKLVRYSLVAGRRALETYGWEDAERYFRRGLAALEGQPMDDSAAHLTLGLARVLSAIGGKVREEWANYQRAYDYFERVGDIPNAIAAADHPIAAASRLPGMAALSGRALRLAPPDSLNEGRLLARHAWDIGIAEGRYEPAAEGLERALTIARREGDVGLEARVLARLAALSGRHLRWPECLVYAQRGLDLQAASPRASDTQTFTWGVRAALVLGEKEEADIFVAFGLAQAERSRQPTSQAAARSMEALLALSAGQWTEARRALEGTLVPANAPSRQNGLAGVLRWTLRGGAGPAGGGFSAAARCRTFYR